jgi:hypothetical protein
MSHMAIANSRVGDDCGAGEEISELVREGDALRALRWAETSRSGGALAGGGAESGEGGVGHWRSRCAALPSPPARAESALAALRATTCECAAAARRFSPEQSAEAVALANKIQALFSRSPTAATAELPAECKAPLLPQLPTELIVEVLRHLDVRSLGRLACTCRQLYFDPLCPPRPMSLVETAIRRRADEVGRWTPSSLPASVSKWVPFLLQREWRIGMERRTVAAGQNRSFFVDAHGALLACRAPKQRGLLGLPGDHFLTVAVPTPVPSLAGICIRSVVCHDQCNFAVSEAGQVFAWGRPEVWRDVCVSLMHASQPTLFVALKNHRVCQVVAGEFHCAALTENGALFTWDIRGYSELDRPAPELGYGYMRFRGPYRVLKGHLGGGWGGVHGGSDGRRGSLYFREG